MKKTPLAASLVALMIAEGVHYQSPDALPPNEHIEPHPAPLPMQGGRPTAWLTSTSTAAPAAGIADLEGMFKSLTK